MIDAGRQAKGPLVLACIVTVSVALSLVWMLLVPFLQEPDEDLHFDYAYALYSVGHPYRVPHARCSVAATAVVRYLERRTDFYGVRLLADARVPAGYGSSSGFRSIDASRPLRIRGVPSAGSDVPCVMFTYPAGFYAVAAAAIALGGSLSHGSLGAEFLSARALGIVCLAITLVLAYRLMRASRMTVRDTSLATAAIGFFPMTSWESAYVQPDNLVFTAVTLALWLALRLKRYSHETGTMLALGGVLSVLCFVKQQDAGLLLLVCVPLVCVRVVRRGAARYSSVVTIALVCLMPLAAMRASTFATPAGAVAILHPQAPTSRVPEALGADATIRATIASAALAARDAYVAGPTLSEYWNGFGWTYGEFFEPPGVDFALESIIGAISCVLAAVFIVGRLAIVRRILRVAIRHRGRTAIRLLCDDVVLNTYVAWSVMLIVVSGLARGTWALQGRYWLPVMVPLLIVLARNLPRPLPVAWRARAATILVSMLLGYSLIGAPFALAAAYARYYRATGTPVRSTVVAVEGLGFFGQRNAPHVFSLNRGQRLAIAGLAFRATDGSRIARVELAIDAAKPTRARYGLPVQTGILRLPLGFRCSLTTAGLRAGRHRITVLAYGDAGHVDRWQNELFLVLAPGGAAR